MDNAEKHAVLQVIEQQGSINFHDFINLCLYHPKSGYYRYKNPFGMGGDFITSSQLTSLFGELVGLFFASQWQRMCNGKPFTFVELGAGNGFFLRDMLRATKNIEGFWSNIRIAIVEISESLIEEQKTILSEFEDVEINWYVNIYEMIDELPENDACFIFANEFFDAFAVRQFVRDGVDWLELMVAKSNNGDKLEVVKSKTSYTGFVAPVLSMLGGAEMNVPEGGVIEVSFEAYKTFGDLCGVLESRVGCMVMIDYGYLNNQFVPTVQGLRQHKHCDILDIENLGECDITYLLDFGVYYRLASRHQVNVYSPLTQKSFLESLGIEQRLELLAKQDGTSKEKLELTKIAVDRLIATDKMGDLFKVLIVENAG